MVRCSDHECSTDVQDYNIYLYHKFCFKFKLFSNRNYAQKRFYTRGTLRSKEIPRLAKIQNPLL